MTDARCSPAINAARAAPEDDHLEAALATLAAAIILSGMYVYMPCASTMHVPSICIMGHATAWELDTAPRRCPRAFGQADRAQEGRMLQAPTCAQGAPLTPPICMVA